MPRPEVKAFIAVSITMFEYTSEDFSLTTNTWAPGSAFELSKFDLELRKRWDKAMSEGAFRYNIDHIITRIIPGPKHYVAQLNLLRAKERRKPQDIRSINQPFNEKQFNFTWVRQNELIFNLYHIQSPKLPRKGNCTVEMGTSDEENGDDDSGIVNGEVHHTPTAGVVINGATEIQKLEPVKPLRHAVVINVSPMEYGHTLLVPQIDQCLPQILTETSIAVAVEMTLLSKHRGFRMGFNSLCAFASVNHLHLHAYYLEHELIVEYCPVHHLAGSVYEITTMPVPGFGFQIHGSTIQQVSRDIHKVSSYFQEADIAHNLFICRGTVFGEERGSENTTVRVFIWPRRKFIGTKNTQCSDLFNVAVVEMSGQIVLKEEDGYHMLTEESTDTIIADSQLPSEHYQEIKKTVIEMFTPSTTPTTPS